MGHYAEKSPSSSGTDSFSDQLSTPGDSFCGPPLTVMVDGMLSRTSARTPDRAPSDYLGSHGRSSSPRVTQVLPWRDARSPHRAARGQVALRAGLVVKPTSLRRHFMTAWSGACTRARRQVLRQGPQPACASSIQAAPISLVVRPGCCIVPCPLAGVRYYNPLLARVTLRDRPSSLLSNG
jgi:hypothetical protein